MPILLAPEPPAVNDHSLAHWLSEGKALLLRVAGGMRLRDAFKARRLLDEQARRLLHGVVGAVEPVVVAMTEALEAAKLKLGGWWQAMKAAVIPGHFAVALAVLNDPNPSPADLAAIAQQANRQVGFLAQFRQQLATGRQLLSGAPARAALYAHGVWASAMAVRAAQMRRNGYREEKSILGIADHCIGCINEAAQGWVPIGSLVPIGSRTCLSRCHCYMQYR